MPYRKNHEDNPFALYSQAIKEHPLLDKEGEIRLARRIQNGDKKAVDQLVMSNLRFLIKIVLKYSKKSAIPQNTPVEDLMQEGFLGLRNAAETFDPECGARFVTHAQHHIKQHILGFFQKNARGVVVIQGNFFWLIGRYQKVKDSLRKTLGRNPTKEEIGCVFKLKGWQSDLLEKMTVAAGTESISNIRPGYFRDVVCKEDSPDKSVATDDLLAFFREEVGVVLDTHFSQRDRQIIPLLFGFHGGPVRQTVLAEQFGVTKKRIRQIKQKFIKKLHESILEQGALDDLL